VVDIPNRQPSVPGLRRIAAMQHRAHPVNANAGLNRALHRQCHPREHRAAPPWRNPMPEIKPIPDGYRSIIPYLIVADGAAALAFYQQVFGARVRMRLDGPGGKIGHAELEIGDGLIMLADEHPAMGALAPPTVGGTPVALHLYLEDVDAVAAKAIAAGAKLKRPVENQFYGDRLGTVEDPFGHVWHISTHVEDVSPEEINRRAAAMAKEHAG
jgi:PhnB protein